MFKPMGLRLCQLFMLLEVISYTDTVRSIALGAFDTIGLPGPMIRMEAVANGFSALGWAAALMLSVRTPATPLAARITHILAGMMWFDVLTTWPLDMPLPDGFLYWGSVVVGLQLAVGFALERRATAGPTPQVPGWYRGAYLAFAAIFVWSAYALSRGDFIGSDLPDTVHAAHLMANALEAFGWLMVFVFTFLASPAWAARLALFLIGMWGWDMMTTLPLALPLPPQQVIWGPASLMVMGVAVLPLLSASLSQEK